MFHINPHPTCDQNKTTGKQHWCFNSLWSSDAIWRHIWVNTDSGKWLVAWRQQTITSPHIGIASSKVFCGIHQRPTPHEMLMNLAVTCDRRLHMWNYCQGANELKGNKVAKRFRGIRVHIRNENVPQSSSIRHQSVTFVSDGCLI